MQFPRSLSEGNVNFSHPFLITRSKSVEGHLGCSTLSQYLSIKKVKQENIYWKSGSPVVFYSLKKHERACCFAKFSLRSSIIYKQGWHR